MVCSRMKITPQMLVMLLFSVCLILSGCGKQGSDNQEKTDGKVDVVLTAEVFRTRFNEKLSELTDGSEVKKFPIGELQKISVDEGLPFEQVSSNVSNCYYSFWSDKETGKLRQVLLFVEGNRYQLFSSLVDVLIKSMPPDISQEDLSRIQTETFLQEERKVGKCTINDMTYSKVREGEGYTFSIADKDFTDEYKAAYTKIIEVKKAKENKISGAGNQSGKTPTKGNIQKFRPPDTVNAPGIAGTQHLISPLLCDGKYWYLDYTLSKTEVREVGTNVGIVSALYFPVINLLAFDENMNYMGNFYVGIYPEVYNDGSMEYFWLNPNQYNQNWGDKYNLTADRSIAVIGDNTLPMVSIVKLALAKWVHHETGERIENINGIPNDNNNSFYGR